MVSSLAFLFQVLKAVPWWGNTVFRRKIHESRHGRLTQFRRTPKGDFILAIKFEGRQSSRLSSESVLCSKFAALRSSEGNFTLGHTRWPVLQ
jgi:hypothetical protein